MADLAAFLAARLDEDEAVAQACQEFDPYACEDVKGVHWTTERAMREVAAKRAILAEYEEAAQRPYDLPEGVRDGRDDDERERDQYALDILEDVVRHLAAVYRDHPDYDTGWAVIPPP